VNHCLGRYGEHTCGERRMATSALRQPAGRTGAELLFQVFADRYERACPERGRMGQVLRPSGEVVAEGIYIESASGQEPADNGVAGPFFATRRCSSSDGYVPPAASSR
jgi:hypothetical protein